MNNRKSAIVKIIEQTTDFSEYKFLDNFNRNPNKQHVDSIIASLKLFGGDTAWVTVIETKAFGKKELYIIDGQHTSLASEQSGIPVNVIIIRLTNDTVLGVTQYMAMKNSISKEWSTDVYLNAYSENGIREYKLFALLKKQHKLTMTDLLYIFLGNGGAKENKAFKSGEMKFLDEAKSLKLLKALLEVRNLIPNKAFIRRAFYKKALEVGNPQILVDAMLSNIKTVYSSDEKTFQGDLVGVLRKAKIKA